jgi:hypothetical protein
MPRVEPPPVRAVTDIELFANAYFNIELTDAQMQMIAMVATGKPMKELRWGKQTGKSTAQKVILAYLQEGLKKGGRVRLPQHPLPPIDKKNFTGVTQEGRILALIKRPGGAYNFELSRFALKYTSVISALRKDGHDIVADRQYLKNGKASNTWRYRLGGH